MQPVVFTRIIGEQKRAECVEQPANIQQIAVGLQRGGCELLVELLDSNDVVLTVTHPASNRVLAEVCCPNSEVVPAQVAEVLTRAASTLPLGGAPEGSLS